MLEPPEYDEGVEYLWRASRELHGQSGVGLSGFLPLTHTTIRDAMQNLDVHYDPQEIAALLVIDKAYLYPGEPEED